MWQELQIKMDKLSTTRWAEIARYLPGRTDSAVKNFWNSNMKKKLVAATPSNDHPQTYNDQDHQVSSPSSLLKCDEEIKKGIDVDVELPPLPPSFMGDSCHVLDQHLPDNFDFNYGQTMDPDHLEMQFETCGANCADLLLDNQPNIQFLDVIP
ncbi:myb-related protein Hv33-like [Rutidosis leptorrhynchoides]|uniref:myb-related protein Hv33-like n=1 Tax=Rutidosis leptorrhynchoides TaxID=125765 RepID=UPI003A9903CE